MRSGLRGALLSLALLAAPAAYAQTDADLVFWTSLGPAPGAAEYQAYLKAFPDGKFASLARLRLEALAKKAQTAAPPATPAPIAAGKANLVIVRPSVRAVDRIAIDVDARSLRGGSNLLLIVVPAGTPDALDVDTLSELGTRISAQRLHMTLAPADTQGANEVRLYFIPRFATAFTIAARGRVDVGPAAPGSVVVASLTREAEALGAVGFEAQYRDKTLRVDGQFLRLISGTSVPDLVDLLRGQSGDPARYVVLYLGHLGTPASGSAPSEVACVLPADDASLGRIAALKPGDEVVMEGIGSTWGAGRGAEFVVFNPCRLAG